MTVTGGADERQDADAPVCARCRSAQPVAARYCHRCGHDHLDPAAAADRRSLASERTRHFVVRPSERVHSCNVVTALLPLSTGRGVRAYTVAMLAGALVPIVAAAAGWVAFAVVAAAVAVPVVFSVYLFDVNEWEDQPLAVVLTTLVAAALLGAAALWCLDELAVDTGETASLAGVGEGGNGFGGRRVVITGVIAPLVALVLALAGPLWLASRRRFDDMIDGLTFAAVSGAAYAAGETVMRHRGILQSEAVQRGDAALWMSIVANSAVVRPVVYGSALAIAAAAFSGVGPGYSGFTRRFGRAAAVAAGAMVAYGAGVAVLDEVGGWVGPALGLAWGVLVAAVLVVVLRTRLHLGILEAALGSVQGRPSRHEVVAGANCGECEMNLAPLALFCNACGTSVRAVAKPRQHANVGGAMTGGPR